MTSADTSECTKSPIVDKTKKKQSTHVSAQFLEDNDRVEMSVDGQEDEFLSEVSSEDEGSVKITVSRKQLEKWRSLNKQQDRAELLQELGILSEDENNEQRHSKKNERKDRKSRPSSLSDSDREESAAKRLDRSRSRESGEVSEPESEASTNNGEVSREHADHKASKSSKRKKRRSLEKTFDKMQRIIDRKGFVDADAMKKLKRKIDFERHSPAKRHVGSGDREPELNRDYGSSSKRGRVTFYEQENYPSPSDITIYEDAVKMK